MNRKLVFVCSLLCIIAVIFGVTNFSKIASGRTNKEIAAASDKSVLLENNIPESKSEALKGTVEEQVSVITTLENNNADERYNIIPAYTADVNSYERKIGFYIKVPNDMPLKEKLDNVSKILSEQYFNNLPIEVLRIEELDGKKIVVINLEESKENQGVTDFEKLTGRTWATGFFQGSTGGTITSTTLVETFLQRESKDVWVDGVKFLYNNGVCDFEHVPNLYKINYR
jgi:hypothetical protein